MPSCFVACGSCLPMVYVLGFVDISLVGLLDGSVL